MDAQFIDISIPVIILMLTSYDLKQAYMSIYYTSRELLGQPLIGQLHYVSNAYQQWEPHISRHLAPMAGTRDPLDSRAKKPLFCQGL